MYYIFTTLRQPTPGNDAPGKAMTLNAWNSSGYAWTRSGNQLGGAPGRSVGECRYCNISIISSLPCASKRLETLRQEMHGKAMLLNAWICYGYAWRSLELHRETLGSASKTITKNDQNCTGYADPRNCLPPGLQMLGPAMA